LAAWHDFLARAGGPAEQRNTRSAIEDPGGHGPRPFFQQVPEGKFLVRLPTFAQVSDVLEGPSKS
jgi:hypothetical protein